MIGKVLAFFLLVALVGGIGYYAWSGGFINQQKVESLVKPIVFPQKSGDVMLLYPQPESPVQTTTTPTRGTSTNGTTGYQLQNSTITGNVGETYGHLEQTQTTLPKDTYQTGIPFYISGKIIQYIPGSCKPQSNGETKCETIYPATFQYRFLVTCQFRDFCSLSDIDLRGRMTDNSGYFSERVIPTGTSFTKGIYKAQITANSEVNDASGKPYENILEYYFTIIP